MLAMAFVMGGPDQAVKQGSGLLAAHLYDFLTRIWPTFGGGRRLIETPRLIQRLAGDDRSSTTTRDYGTAFSSGQQGVARSQPTTSQGRGWTSALANWNGRGQGRRLGGN